MLAVVRRCRKLLHRRALVAAAAGAVTRTRKFPFAQALAGFSSPGCMPLSQYTHAKITATAVNMSSGIS